MTSTSITSTKCSLACDAMFVACNLLFCGVGKSELILKYEILVDRIGLMNIVL